VPEKKQPQAILHNVHYMFASHSLPQAQHRQSYNVHYVQGLRQIAARLPAPTHPAKSPTTLSMVQGIYYFNCHLLAAHASFFTSLHYRASLHCATFRYIPFIIQHKPQQRTASVAHSLHYAISGAQLHYTATQANEYDCFYKVFAFAAVPFRFPPIASFRSIATLVFPDPIQRYALRSCSPQKSKNKGNTAMNIGWYKYTKT